MCQAFSPPLPARRQAGKGGPGEVEAILVAAVWPRRPFGFVLSLCKTWRIRVQNVTFGNIREHSSAADFRPLIDLPHVRWARLQLI
jgi:hypothetical protein